MSIKASYPGSIMSRIFSTKKVKLLLYGGLLPIDLRSNDRILSKTAINFDTKSIDNESGLDRLRLMFKFDEFGRMSAELTSVCQAGYLGIFVGAVYGGIMSSRTSYMDFMENNQATTFKSHLDAKRNLQDKVTMSFAKGAFKWGWRIGLFTISYAGIITCISVYREKSTLSEYLIAGGMTGAAYKMNMGLRGIAVGGGLGAALGGISGCVSLLLLHATGSTMREVRYWQYKWKLDRYEIERESIKAQSDPDPHLLQHHDKQIGENQISLEKLTKEE